MHCALLQEGGGSATSSRHNVSVSRENRNSLGGTHVHNVDRDGWYTSLVGDESGDFLVAIEDRTITNTAAAEITKIKAPIPHKSLLLVIL